MNQPTHAELEPPLIEGYRALTLIAEGGFSSVYKAYQDTFSRMVAIKVLHTDAHDPAAQQQFQHECQLTGRLTGRRHIITVFDAGITLDQRPYIAMQYLPNGSLADRLRKEGPLPVGDVLDIGAAIAGALDAANKAGILHRDVKPGNILVSDDGEPVLSDFGIATLADPTSDPNSVDAFTVAHTAPEVLEGAPASVRSDIYALGSTLYTLLAGLPPFGRHSGQTTMYRVLQVRRTRVPELGHLNLPAGVEALLRRTLADDPQQRPNTFAELAAELAALRDDPEHVAAPPAAGAAVAAEAVTTAVATTAVVAEHPAPLYGTSDAFTSNFGDWGSPAEPVASIPATPWPTLPNDQSSPRRSRRVRTTIAVTAMAAVLVAGVVIASTVLRPEAAGHAVGQPSASSPAATSVTSATTSTTAASETSPSPGATSEVPADPGAGPNAGSPGAGNPAGGQQTPGGPAAGQGANPGPPAPSAPGPNPGPGCNSQESKYKHTPYAIGGSAPWVCGTIYWYGRSAGMSATMQSQETCSGNPAGVKTVYTGYDSAGTQQATYSTGYTCGTTNIGPKNQLPFDQLGGLVKVAIDLYVNNKLIGQQTCLYSTQTCS